MTEPTDQVTLRAYIRDLMDERDRRYGERFDAQALAVAAALTAAKEAVQVGETNAQRWRESANEWRGAMSDRESSFLSRLEYNAEHKALENKVNSLQARVDKSEGQSRGLSKVGATAVGTASILAAIAIVITLILVHG